MNFIDTHVHLQDFTSENVKDILTTAFEVGLDKLICVGSKPDDWEMVESISSEYSKQIIPAFGLHPWYVNNIDENWSQILEVFLSKNKNALVGEIGLDGYKEYIEKQIEVFEKQLLLARKFNRPIIIHSVKAQNWFENNWRLLPDKFVFHSYFGKKEFLKEIISHNGYVSFSFSILKNKDVEELINMVPIHKMLLETDSPYQAENKDSENEPAKLPQLFYELAKIRKIEQKEFAEHIYNNSLEFMKIG